MKLSRQRLMRVENGVEPFPLNLFPKLGPVSVELDQFNKYRLLQPLGSDLWWNIEFVGTYSAGGERMRISNELIAQLWAGFAIDNTRVTTNGSWSTTISSSYFTGRYSSTNANGAYVQIVTDAGVTAVGCYVLGVGNGNTGVAVVSIDGDNTLANLLMTAQAAVDAGLLPNTVLVANGGTLNPTDRIFDSENIRVGGNGVPMLFATGLTPGSHTVRISRTGYKESSSSGTSILFCGFICYGYGLYGVNQTYRYMHTYQTQRAGEGGEEVSWFFKPTGTSNGAWLGHTGMAKIIDLPVITVDGVNQSTALLTRNTIITGSKITIFNHNDVRHPETGTTSQGIWDITYTLTPGGMDIYHKTSWGVSGTVYGFPCMMDVSYPTFTRVASRAGGTYTLGADMGNHVNTSANQIWAFVYPGNQAKIMTIPDLLMTVNNWNDQSTPGTRLYFFDGNTVEKAYANRINSGAGVMNFTNATVFESRAIYRTAWMTDTAKLIV